jgi:hypothetical protein
MKLVRIGILLGFLVGVAAAQADTMAVSIDRFSDQSGHLFRRSAMPGLPAANQPIHFDQGPFITKGLGPDGSLVSYYNFDVMPLTPASIYVLFKEGSSEPVAGQNNIVNVIPGDAGYSDFWNVVKVEVPSTYVANQITSYQQLMAYPMTKTTVLVNCPVVPEGSTADVRYNGNPDRGLHHGWYKGKMVSYFNFSEKALMLTVNSEVPVSPIFVTFNKNPDPNDPSSGPASGFVALMTGQTHNVVSSVPEDRDYSPLWNVNFYNNQGFAMVQNLNSVFATQILATNVANVNCPIVSKGMH